MRLDLAKYGSVATFAAEFKSYFTRLDSLVLNRAANLTRVPGGSHRTPWHPVEDPLGPL
jgi:hypothetical protein